MSISAFIKRHTSLACAYYILDAKRTQWRLGRGDIATVSGTRHSGLSLEESLAYIEKVHRDYLAWSGRPALTGRIAEIGPGDNFGVALLLLKGGAEFVDAIDKFAPRRDAAQQTAIYAAMSRRHQMDGLFDGEPGESTITRVRYHPGMPAERFFNEQSGFSAVLSRAVLEHLDDPLKSLDDMWRSLEPGGMLIHRVDLRDHGMFAGAHPLTFLTIGSGLYAAMTRQTGRPNRILLPHYRAHVAKRGWSARFGVTRLAGVAEEFANLPWDALPQAARQQAVGTVRAIRPKLARPFSALPDADLAVSGFVLVAEKPVNDPAITR